MITDVLIIGGGAAGMKAAVELKRLGHTSIIIEKQDKLGGHLRNWDRLFPQGILANEVVRKLKEEISSQVYMNIVPVEVHKRTDTFEVSLSSGESVQCKSILLATGFKLFPSEKKEEYGYNIYNRVITNADLEAYFQTKKDERILQPTRIGFVHCVGSRDEKAGNRQCSKVCCVTAVKQAMELKEIFPEAEVFCFYMDLRMFGRGYEDMYLEAQSKFGVRFIRGRVSEVAENENGLLVIKAEDTLNSKPLKITLDLLVLMAGITANRENSYLSEKLSLSEGEDGFCNCKDIFSYPNYSNTQGVFLAGTVTGPKTLPETMNDASASALAIHSYLKKTTNE